MPNDDGVRIRTVDVVPQIAIASALCSAMLVEFTIPQVTKLSLTSSVPLPAAALQARLAIQARALGPQTAITCFQFALVREARRLIDAAVGPNPANQALAYGAASVPLISLKYNMLFSNVYSHWKLAPPEVPGETRAQFCRRQWETKVRPGLAWSYLRDTGSIGGAVVLGPLLAARIRELAEPGCDTALPPSRALQFGAGLLTGCATGLATQTFHNAALTAGRMAGLGERPTTVSCMRRLLAEQGPKAVYLNFPPRVGVIASWSAILNVTQPFQV